MPHLGIQLGTKLSLRHAWATFYLGGLVYVISAVGPIYHNVFGALEKKILQSHNISITEGSDIFFCDLPYTDCLCSLSRNKSDSSHNCIARAQLISARMSPLISFFGEIYLMQKLFSWNGNQRHVIIYASWMVSILIFIGITITIHWSSCYHAYISYTIFGISGLLWLLSMHTVVIVHRHFVSLYQCKQVVVDSKPETDTKETQTSKGLI